MFGGMDPRKMNAMMSQMGIKSTEIDAEEVIIKGKGKNIIIKNPSVTKVNMPGQEMFQVIGKAVEEESISEEDVQTVMSQTGASNEKASQALKTSEGDIAKAILSLKH